MHLKTLTLRGFKSFASATTLHFEPGVTCVVGPNGSGKSNIVDALAWVMGEQGAKSLRGGSMEDVIFAGTAGRPALGRAEVSLTIDNTDGVLPVEYAEVTLTRTMFRSGGSDYAINGQGCRLLDIQELLSDSGIGREMHVIVGQGRLDAVLSASPEDRRGFVEEAAGVLKHRRRKEKALRKLEAMGANLTRLQDLTGELRRQLKPLGRQADIARRAAAIQADLRDARLRLLADDVATLTALVGAAEVAEAALRARQEDATGAVARCHALEAELGAAAAADAPVVAAAEQTWYDLIGVRERLRSTAALAAERLRASAEPVDLPAGRYPDELAAEAAGLRAQEAALQAAVVEGRATLAGRVTAREAAENEHTAEVRRQQAARQALADRREGLARLTGQVDGLRRRVAGAAEEVARLGDAHADALARAGAAQREFAALESTVAGLSVGEHGLDDAYELAGAALDRAERAVEALRAHEREAERDRVAAGARAEALSLSLARRDGAGALLERGLGGPDPAGVPATAVLGSLAALLGVEPGAEAAVAAALGAVADAVAVATLDDAVDAVRLLRDQDLGQATVVVARPAPATAPTAPDGGLRAVADLVSAPPELRAALDLALRDMVLVDDLPAARAVVAELPHLTAVTRLGDVVGATLVCGGSASAPTLLEVQVAYEEATAAAADALHRRERIRFGLAQADVEHRAAADAAAGALDRLHESDAELAGVADQLGRLGQVARAARAEADRLAATIERAEQARHEDAAALVELEQRLAAAQREQVQEGLFGSADGDPAEHEADDATGLDGLTVAAAAARGAETEARLALRTVEERGRAVAARAEGLESAAAIARAAVEQSRRRHETRRQQAVVAAAVQRACVVVLDGMDRSLAAAAADRDAAHARRHGRDSELAAVREQARRCTADLDEATAAVHRDEVLRAEQRLRLEALHTRAADELGLDRHSLVAEYGPAQPLLDADGAPRRYVRAEQDKRARAAEREVTLLGAVNPLAMEEFAALEERLAFLIEQVRDVEATRKDLLDIVRDVDARVERVFTEAYHDVEREFADVFARLFPGGSGRLVLTDPSDMLTTGIEVEARPPGKRVKRLSLLSGGERSLVAVAFLVALFKARPSPFYVLDEVEAALDDVNLGRLLELYRELRESSQLIVVTHQKRTMEVADALYGVSMRGDGVTALISQRLEQVERAAS